jgi:hydrogenase maturation protease
MPSQDPSVRMPRVLIIGYGNTVRGDDAAGVRAVETLARELPQCECMTVAQLSAEHAEDISRADIAVLVDADVHASEVTVRTIAEGHGSGEPRSHAASPEFLLDLSRQIYGRVPQRMLVVGIPATSFDFSEQLTPQTASAVEESVRRVKAEVERFFAESRTT